MDGFMKPHDFLFAILSAVTSKTNQSKSRDYYGY
jgi:hypothetical protein